MGYKIRAILDVENDAFRDLIVDKNESLEHLHLTIAKAFGFKGQEMASFYKTNSNWEQGEEIPLINMSENPNALDMQNCCIENVLQSVDDKLIYIYDFFSMWTFYIELKETAVDTSEKLPVIALAFGEVPEQAPEKTFTSTIELADEEDDLFNSEESFENIDDIDLENY
ncbi:MAG TPA: hypothetical protein VJ970_01375 [Flavobacteriaceae bacterium]|nr:hypothetical protein [Flavobacteriaceae bacterium]